MKIRDFLKIKGRPAITIGPNESVAVATQKLIDNRIGALPVCDDQGRLVGIISERDLLKECFQHSGTGTTKVEDIMTKKVVVGFPEDDLDYATSVMKQKRIRHLPIVVEHKLEGIISMRDLIDMQLEETKAQIRYMGLIGPHPSRRILPNLPTTE